MTDFTKIKNYTLIETKDLKDVSAVAYTLKHNKTGARVVLLENDDDNKGFVIGFKTPQDNSTGVPHILEHSVLCGSDRFPVKDAMTQVSKGSLNTFLNAFTYPDRTLYPVASCNDKDFQNLMSVYLDAVFFPRVLNDKRVFMQEGWHYELESQDASIIYNGVVYNEMKGVYSSPESALNSYIMFSLFPDTQYGVESGGDPDCIPDLSYEEFCAFHKKLYHPSNSRIFLYGKMDFINKLEYIDREYLSRFEKIEPDSEVKLQTSFKVRKRIEKEYSIADNEETTDKTFLSYNVVCSDYKDVKTTEVMNAINYALCSVPGAKLKERLLEAGIGKDVYSEFTTDVCQKVFSIIAEDANPEDEDEFVKIIEETMAEIIEEGFDKKALEASITGSEFAYREADYGYYPKGIAYGTLTFEQWLYSDENIFFNLELNSLYSELRNSINSGLFERVLKERVLENEHKTILIMKPKKGLGKEKEECLAKKLAEYKSSLSEEEIDRLVKETAEFKQYQEEPDTEEALATIPTLSLEDIKKEFTKCEYEKRSIDGVTEIYSDVNSNGIVYFTLSFDAGMVPKSLLPALSIVKTLLGYTDTKSYKFGDLINECNIKSGGIGFNTNVYKNYKNTDSYKVSFEVKCRALYEYLPDSFELIKEMLFTSKLSDKKRVKENLEQSKLRIQGYMIQSGHAVAVGQAAATLSDGSAMNEILSGLKQYRYMEEILADFDNRFDSLVKEMQEVLDIVLCKDNLEISLGCEERGRDIFEKAVSEFIDNLKTESKVKTREHITATGINVGLSAASMVQYVACCGNYVKEGNLPYKGSIQVLKSLLNTDYLWTAVRLQGGAYGCFCFFSAAGDSMMVSYRDPNLKKTIEAYKKTVDFVKNYDGDAEEVERYIISTIGDYDTPLTPSIKTSRAFNFYKMGITNEEKQKERDEILSTTAAEIRSLWVYLEKVLAAKRYSCVRGEDMLAKEGDIFDEIKPLIKA